MMNVKTQSPVYINKKKVSNRDVYVGDDGSVSVGPYAPGFKPGGDTLPNSPLSSNVPASGKGQKLKSLFQKGKSLFQKGKNVVNDTKAAVSQPASDTVAPMPENKGASNKGKNPADESKMSMTTKVVISVGVIGILGGLFWLANRKK